VRARRNAAAATRPRATAPASRRKPRSTDRKAVAAVPVTATDLRELQRELERRLAAATARPAVGLSGRRGTKPPAPMRWNPDTDDVQRSVAQLVLTIVEFLRQLMERQAIRRMEAKTLSESEIEAVGQALMRLEDTVREMGARFGLAPEDLNLDLGPVKLI
jgi:hypothetical protein